MNREDHCSRKIRYDRPHLFVQRISFDIDHRKGTTRHNDNEESFENNIRTSINKIIPMIKNNVQDDD
jgi:hypothetical protein